MKDLSKIDFTKLKLPEWCDGELRVRFDGARAFLDNNSKHECSEVAFLACDGWAAGKAANGYRLDELASLQSICAQVDAFIAAELAKLEPEWVEIKPSEVERLRKAGARVRHEMSEEIVKNIMGDVVARVPGAELCVVDLKTVPAGVNLYKPEWIDVPWIDVSSLGRFKSCIRAKVNGAWLSLDDYCKRFNRIHDTHKWQADRKTCPPGYEPTKPEAATADETKLLSTLCTKDPYDTEKGVYCSGVLEPGAWKIVAVRVW